MSVGDSVTISISKDNHYHNGEFGIKEKDMINIGSSFYSPQYKKNNRVIARMLKKVFCPHSTVKEIIKNEGAVTLTMNPIKIFKTF